MTDYDAAILRAAERLCAADRAHSWESDNFAALRNAVAAKREAQKPRLTKVDDLVADLLRACQGRMMGTRRELKGHDVAFALRMRDEEWRDAIRKLPEYLYGFSKSDIPCRSLSDLLALSDAP